MTTNDHSTYTGIVLHQAIIRAAEERAKKSAPKAWKTLKDLAPHYPLYNTNDQQGASSTYLDEALTAWSVNVRVQIDQVVKDLVKLTTPKPASEPGTGTGTETKETPSEGKSVADV